MKCKRKFFYLLTLFSIFMSLPLQASDAAVSPKAYVLFNIGSFPITNGMLYTWVISLAIIFVVRWAVGKPQLIPSKGQAIVEGIINNVYQLVAPIVGRKAAPTTFPLLIGFFLYILMHNWSSLLPGVGTLGSAESNGHFLYYFRPANADLNSTLALALVSLFAWLYFILKYVGLKGSLFHTFGNKVDRKEVSWAVYSMMTFVFLGVGFIECISILFRVVSLSFRLYGNVFGGENLLNNIMALAPWSKYLLPVPFYFLEVLIGLIQAFVFTLLVAVYIGLICNHDEETPQKHAA